jgi:alcohol dehydrogenase class IV
MKTVANNDAFHGTWESLQRDLGKILEYTHTDVYVMTPTHVAEFQNRLASARKNLDEIQRMYPVEKPAGADRLADIAKTVGGFKA